MADPSPSPPCRSSTTVNDLDVDSLTHCASYLSLSDISSMAMSCKHLNRAAYSDSIWQSLYRQTWPHVVPLLSHQSSSIREAYLSRHTDVRQFKYVDPLVSDTYKVGKPPHQILFDRNNIIFSQGPSVHSLHIDHLINGSSSLATLGNHNARITCMRLFSLSATSQSKPERDDNILVTSSSDHSIRLWSKGGSRCFKGHNGPVFTLSDKLLGDDTGKIFASGGEDGTVRLWSIYSSAKRGHHALKASLHGHDRGVSLMAVAGHKTSLLVSISKNGKVRVWDTNTASSTRSSCCVGMTAVPSPPVGMKCHESLLYVAAGSSVITVDLRTMNRVSTLVHEAMIHSFEVLPSKSMLCTGETGRAMLWDIRKFSNTHKVEPTFELDGHVGPVKLLHMDSHKIVTGGPDDPYVNVWDPDTSGLTNSLNCASPNRSSLFFGCSAMAVDGCRIVTSSGVGQGNCFVRFRDFNTAKSRVSTNLSETNSTVSKFWGSHLSSDSEESDS